MPQPAHSGSACRARRPGRRADDRGQATVELALAIPVIVFFVLVVLQFTLVARDQLLVTHAAREGARHAATNPTADAGGVGARRSTDALDHDRLAVTTTRRGAIVTVTVTYRSPTALPLVGHLVPDPTLRAAVTMAIE